MLTPFCLQKNSENRKIKKEQSYYEGFDVYLVVEINEVVVWVMTPCSLVGGRQRSGEIRSLTFFWGGEF